MEGNGVFEEDGTGEGAGKWLVRVSVKVDFHGSLEGVGFE